MREWKILRNGMAGMDENEARRGNSSGGIRRVNGRK